MRYFGSYNRNKGLFTESKDIMIYQKAREEDHQRRQEANLETDSDTHVGMWLLCHPDNDLATAMYSKLFLLQLEVTHDDVISWLGTAIRCHPSHLVPSGRALTIREKPTLSAELRVGYWNTGIGITQACLLMQYLGTCKLNKLSLDERANVLFAVLRIFGHCDEIAANPHAQQFLRLLYASGDRIQGIEAFASIFFQFSNAIRTLWKLTEDEPLVMRLTVEILMCLCQRPEIVATLPDFTMAQMYKEEALSQDHHAAEQRDLIERGFGIPVPGPSHRNDSLQNGGIHGEDDDEILDELNDEELAYEEDVEIGEDEEDEEEEVHANGDILPPPINEREEEEDDDDEIEEGAVVKLEVPDDGEYDSAKVAVD
ncbi:hypothetical protein CAEBREN_03332 [Caenorhabditis brenneri]|uniref:Uncharacterized protein n=1 Tax=Caenorhabditis brenneri TaxID=135651 RepID=G0NQZ8_CAEBE|nr:hypothetical protein CAEBREN_03332 [Caenorhabditis brenneri]